MGICWYCHWGWSQQVVEIHDRALHIAGGSALYYGPAHNVWADENFGREHIVWCIEHFDTYQNDYSADELAAVRQSLEELLALPDHIREPEPADYDGQYPEQYPPATGLIMQQPK